MNLHSAFFYGILDTGYVKTENLSPMLCLLIQGGADIVQFRAKGWDRNSMRKELRKLHPIAEAAGIPLIVNDDVHLAAEFEGLGAHIGQDDMSPDQARKILGNDVVLGLSTHSELQADKAISQADLLSYFAVGPVFPTQTKPDYSAVGLSLVRYVADQSPSLPFYCIGGINRKNAAEVVNAGAKRIVSVSDVLLDPAPDLAVKALKAIL